MLEPRGKRITSEPLTIPESGVVQDLGNFLGDLSNRHIDWGGVERKVCFKSLIPQNHSEKIVIDVSPSNSADNVSRVRWHVSVTINRGDIYSRGGIIEQLPLSSRSHEELIREIFYKLEDRFPYPLDDSEENSKSSLRDLLKYSQGQCVAVASICKILLELNCPEMPSFLLGGARKQGHMFVVAQFSDGRWYVLDPSFHDEPTLIASKTIKERGVLVLTVFTEEENAEYEVFFA